MMNPRSTSTRELSPLQPRRESPASPEQSLFEDFSPVLANEFPNPARVGCPPPDVLRGIASGEVQLSAARTWLLHLGSCSPCFRDFLAFRKRAQQQKQLKIALGLVAVLLVSISLMFFTIVHSRGHSPENTLLDLRDWSELRTSEPREYQSSRVPLQIARLDSAVTIYLPVGSSPGPHEVELLDARSHRQIMTMSTSARLENRITMLQVNLRVSNLSAGSYILAIRRPGLDWSFYPVTLK